MLINFTGISKITFAPLIILKKSIWIGSSVIGSQAISFGNTFSDFPSKFIDIMLDKKFSFSIRFLIFFLLKYIFWFFSDPP